MPTAAKPTSPRLRALQRERARGTAAALAAFWREVEAAGAPLVEPLPDDPQHARVTFLWRAAEEVRNVAVVGGLAGFDFARNQLTRLPDTNLWFRTYHARTDLRTMYKLAPNDSLLPLDAATDWASRTATWQVDPLNPRQQRLFDGLTLSVLELPAAPPQPWVTPHPGRPAGMVQARQFASTILGNERRVWTYTPPGYRPDGPPCGLLLLFDGRAYTELVPTPTILDNLIAAGAIPPLVAVLVGNPSQETRNRELPCYAPFADFLTQELLPWARGHFHLSADPAHNVVAGSSYGGLAAAYVGLRHPELFGNVLSQSGAFAWKPADDAEHEWLPQQFIAAPRLPLRFYLDVGVLENDQPRDGRPTMLASNRHMRDILRAKGYLVHYAEFSGGHDYICWRGTLADGLRALLGHQTVARAK